MHVYCAGSEQLGACTSRYVRHAPRAFIHISLLSPGACMWYNTKTQTHRDMRRVQWGQNAQTTTREVSFALMLTDTHETSQNAQQHRSKEA